MIWFWDKGMRRYLKRLYNKVQREIYQAQFNVSIINNLVLGFSKERLRLLKQKEAEWTAKDENITSKKDKADALLKMRDDVKREENAIKGAEMRKEESVEGIKVRMGKLEFIKDTLKGKYS